MPLRTSLNISGPITSNNSISANAVYASSFYYSNGTAFGSGNIDGGTPTTNYGGTNGINGGTP